MDAYGDVDELNSILGLSITQTNDQEFKKILLQIQKDLFALGAQLANPQHKKQKAKADFSAEKITFLEQAIDKCEAEIQPITSFILHGGSNPAGFLDWARTVCRRAERKMVALNAQEKLDEILIIYVNRLSDFLFMLARVANKRLGVKDIPWQD